MNSLLYRLCPYQQWTTYYQTLTAQTFDLVGVFFQCSIHEDSIPLTAVCNQQGIYKWMVMPMGLASIPGWFQSIMLGVCEGLRRVRLFIDNVCFSTSGAEHVQDLAIFFND